MSWPDVDGLAVLICCDYLGADVGGGSERVAVEIARHLVNRGASVRAVGASPRRATPAADLGWLDLRTTSGIDLSSAIGAQLIVSPRALPTTWRAMTSPRAAVIQAHSLHFQSTAMSVTMGALRGIPVVTVAHVAAIDGVKGIGGTCARLYERSVGRQILSRSSAVVAVSDAVAEHVRSLGAEAPIVIPNGVDHERFRPAASSPRTAPHVIFVGRMIKNKGPLDAVKVLALLRDAGLHFSASILGDGPLLGDVREAVAKTNLQSVVDVPGLVNDVDRRMRDADVLLRPSTSEGMPLAVLEAMASGCVVVASDIPGSRTVVQHGVSGLLVPPGDVTAMADAVRRLVADRALYARLRHSAIAAAERHAWHLTAEAHATVLVNASSQSR